ncbi:MAG: AAA family ATPase [Ruthenibacterium sp.]
MQAKRAHVMMLTSGKGGTGKSVVTALLGAALTARGLRVLAVELGCGPRTLDYPTGVYGKTVYDLGDVFAGCCSVEKAVVESPLYPGLSVICAPCSGGVVRPNIFASAVQRMRADFDMILLDTASGLGVPFKAACAVADSAVIVTTPDCVAVRDGHVVADALRTPGHIPARLLLNRVPAYLNGVGVADLDECIDLVGVQLIGVLPESIEVRAAAATGLPLDPGGLSAAAFSAVAARICGVQIPLVIT